MKKPFNKQQRLQSYHGRNQEKPCVSPEQYKRLSEIFVTKGWKIEDDVERSEFHKYFQTLKSLANDKQKELFLDMSSRFLKITPDDYCKSLVVLLNKIFAAYPYRKFMCARCVKAEDENVTKSSSLVQYKIKTPEVRNFLDKKIKEIPNMQYFQKNQYHGEIIVLVDDFIGTGDTAFDAVNYVLSVVPKAKGNIVIMSIASMRSGKQALVSAGYKVFTDHELDRGISDFYEGDALTEAIDTMQEIELKIRPEIIPDFKFGYKASEGLIKLERCPNNTFPIYWLPKNIAPYER